MVGCYSLSFMQLPDYSIYRVLTIAKVLLSTHTVLLDTGPPGGNHSPGT